MGRRSGEPLAKYSGERAMSFFRFLCFVLVLPIVLNAADRPPNIVFILADDLGWNGLSCYGTEVVETPHLDQLASEGMRFTNAYALSQCLPTRAAFFSGQYGARTGLTSVEKESPGYAPMKSPGRPDGLPPETYTVFEMLRDAGYTTGMSGKWHVAGPSGTGRLMKQHGLSYFDEYGFDYVGKSYTMEEDKNVSGTNRDMLEFIEHNRDRPFVAYLPHFSVHTPFAVPEEMIQRYLDLGFKRSSDQDGVFEERVAAEYLAMIDFLDQSVGEVIVKLEALDLQENTILIFASDNGGLTRVWNNDPLRGGKGQLYEGGLRVPLIVKWPGQVAAGTVCDTPVHVVDFFPTFAEIAGGTIPEGKILDGVSLVPLLTESGDLEREAVFSHHPEYVVAFSKTPASMIRKGDYKLIHYFGDYLDPEGCTPKPHTLSGRFVLGSKNELFDLSKDPSETDDLSSAMPEKVEELMEDLEAWWIETGAKFPIQNPNPDPSQWIWNQDN